MSLIVNEELAKPWRDADPCFGFARQPDEISRGEFQFARYLGEKVLEVRPTKTSIPDREPAKHEFVRWGYIQTSNPRWVAKPSRPRELQVFIRNIDAIYKLVGYPSYNQQRESLTNDLELVLAYWNGAGSARYDKECYEKKFLMMLESVLPR
jgi:hypothetical protein